ncbi:uncharacterized protein EV420DRAFT_1484516 [Desarmillaria tabescens]|uniref:Uncharacterized protein n=1 Tax=Armillaria tabescens TaxID=1929756 RepID=A0AA39JLF1_ARMTA|nr:uncharacterized protein EV420DRAFT_1484516 [Desarmillaria tabescens]KAK0444925.1 hypothetical protein EV420DRAFT_1484516 [Desarmillaria tabescens]
MSFTLTDSSSSMATTLIKKGAHFLYSGNLAKPLADVCLICTRKGHKISDCSYQNFKSGDSTKCKLCNDKSDPVVMVKATDAIKFFLDQLNLHNKHPDLMHKLHSSFPMGNFPALSQTVIFPKYISDSAHIAFIDLYFEEKVATRRMRSKTRFGSAADVTKIGSKGFFIEHTCPFGCSSLESNVCLIANAVMDIWSVLKVSPSVNSFLYKYDMQSTKDLIA